MTRSAIDSRASACIQLLKGPTYLKDECMKKTLLMVLLTIMMGAGCAAQTSTGGQENALRITNGPVVEMVSDTMAQIAWSTNASSGTLLRYGTAPDQLDQKAGMPWGAITHRVELKNLKPGTTYCAQAVSDQG